MPTLNFKGKAVIETYHHTVPHHRLEFEEKWRWMIPSSMRHWR